MQLGKTYKIIGTLFIITEKPAEAKKFLMQAYKIFEKTGQNKLIKEVLAKLRILKSNTKGKQEVEIDEQSEVQDSESSNQNESPMYNF